MQTEAQLGERQIILSPSQKSVTGAFSAMHPFVMQSSPVSGFQQNPHSSVQLPMQSVSKQQQPQQQQQRSPNATNLHGRFNGQNIVPDVMQYRQQLLGQNNSSSRNVRVLGQQSNASSSSGQYSNSSMSIDPQNVCMWSQAEVVLQRQAEVMESALLPTQEQKPQLQPENQRLVRQIQLQPLPNPLQQDMHQSLKTSGPVLQPHHLLEQQMHSSEIQNTYPVMSSMARDCTLQIRYMKGDDWKEELYQKIKTTKDVYLPELKEMYNTIDQTLQQLDSNPQHPRTAVYEKIKGREDSLKKACAFLHLPKSEMSRDLERKLGEYDKFINDLLRLNRPQRSISLLQQERHPTCDVQSVQQPFQPRFQNPMVRSNGNQTIPHFQSMSSHHSVTALEKNNVTSLRNASTMSSEEPTSQQNSMNSEHPGTNLVSDQGNTVTLLLQNPGSTSQSGGNVPRGINNHLGLNYNMLQNMCLQQQNEQKMIKAQQAKQQFQQCQMTKQLMQQNKKMEGQHRQEKLQAHQIPQLHHLNKINRVKVREGMNAKSGNYLQNHSVGKLSVNSSHIVKLEPTSYISSPQLLQNTSPQIIHPCSSKISQKILQTSFTNSESHLHSPNSRSFGPSPSTSLAAFHIKADPNKLTSSVSSHSNSGDVGHQETSGALALDSSFVISTHGLSPSHLLAKRDCLDGNHNHVSTTDFCEPKDTGEHIQRLIKVVRLMSDKALCASLREMESVVRMVDRTAGSIPGNGSQSAIGGDLAAVANFLLRGENLGGNSRTMKMRPYSRVTPSNIVAAGSITESFKQLTDRETCNEESTAKSQNKRLRIEVNCILLKEIREINQRLIDTVVDISEEGFNSTAAISVIERGEGTIVRCSFNAVIINPNMKPGRASALVSLVLPLLLLVPRNYPDCSPVLLDKLPAEVREFEDFVVKAKSKLSLMLGNLMHPMSLGEIAKAWDVCARAVICEYAQQNGGGNFSSRYGSWENVLSTA